MNERMISEINHAISRIERAKSSKAVLDRLRRCLAEYGFSQCLITGLPAPDDQHWHRQILCDGWSEEWHARYSEQGHYFHDPCAGESRRTGGAFFWSELEREHMPPRGLLVMEEAREFGMTEGVCVPIHAPHFGPAVVTAAGEFVGLSSTTLPIIDAVCRHAYKKVCVLEELVRHEQCPVLTPREREILQWISAGKGTEDIACILNISRHTVQTHLRNIREKLDVVNAAHAVAEGLRRQEIQI
ncbi:autoinducer binding domain-containing protein [Mesorhizobium sp. YR577]|uniref:autoinducer binding domain-containing protein n=1 Tax=Mesorhizobium sp. YR577 TaxID=1884373 RepID=UPI000B89F21A|nr:autoinducer binding domain-containing protein [Mesorhizobium sp. YR577]